MYYRDYGGVSIASIANRSDKWTAIRHILAYGDSLGDVTDWLSKEPPKWRSKSSKTNSASGTWDLNAGYDGALKLAKDGWQEGVDMIDLALQAIVPASGRAGRYGYSQSGTSVAIGRYLHGNPRNMRSRTRRTMGSAPVLHLIVNVVASCAVRAEQMANFGAAITGLIDRLENSGRRIHLDCVMAIKCNGNARLSMGWNVKKASEPVDLAEVAYSIAHPAAFRRIGFAMMERCPSVTEHSAYGYSCDGLPCDVPDYTDGTMIIDGVNHQPGRCNTPKDALRLAIEQVNKAAVLAGHASVDEPLINEDDWLAELAE